MTGDVTRGSGDGGEERQTLMKAATKPRYGGGVRGCVTGYVIGCDGACDRMLRGCVIGAINRIRYLHHRCNNTTARRLIKAVNKKHAVCCRLR